MHTITRKFEFDAAHRVLHHESKCRHLHGHRYVAELTVGSNFDLDQLGRVIDFSVVKEVVGTWIDENWDHNTILHADDPILHIMGRGDEANIHLAAEVVGRTPYLMGNMNPTAENIAKRLFEQARRLLAAYGIDVINVVIHETPNCSAHYFELPS